MAKAIFAMLVIISCASAQDLQQSLKIAQCRAVCLDAMDRNVSRPPDTECHHAPECIRCWESCEQLATNFAVWSLTCGQNDLCVSGCQTACEFYATRTEAIVPLSLQNTRLTLAFGGTQAEWALTWSKSAPRGRVVFALFTRRPGEQWRLRQQTVQLGTSLADLPPGTELKLFAVGKSGILSVIITPFVPTGRDKPFVKYHSTTGSPRQPEHRPEDNRIPSNAAELLTGAWPLLKEVRVHDSGLVGVRVWWEPQTHEGDYLVTWEVSGGGLKGHLYTDLPEVDLTLWPETMYFVKVELITGPRGQPHHSRTLTLDTHNTSVSAAIRWQQQERLALERLEQERREREEQEQRLRELHRQQNEVDNAVTPTLPLVHRYDGQVRLEVVLGVCVGVVTAALLLLVVLYRCRNTSAVSYDTNSRSSAKWGGCTRSLNDLSLDESLVKSSLSSFSTPPLDLLESSSSPPPSGQWPPIFTLGPPPSSPSSSCRIVMPMPFGSAAPLVDATRPLARVNIYSSVPSPTPPPLPPHNLRQPSRAAITAAPTSAKKPGFISML